MITLIIIIVFIVIAFILMYNRLVSKRNQVDNAYGSIEALLKKRYDLIPNLVESVKGYMKHEADVLNRLTELRARAFSGQLTPETALAMEGDFKAMTARLMAAVENYPELKASENFLQLQAALNEVEEQISAARRAYNAAVKDYNTAIQSIPTNIVASLATFAPRPFFEAAESERGPVDVGKLFSQS